MNAETIRKIYSRYNEMLFRNELPAESEIKLSDDVPDGAVGCTYTDDDGTHTISLSGKYDYTQLQLEEIIVHEMIHIWQYEHVSKNRYKMCTDIIAHDRVFRSRMATINCILDKNGCGFHVTEVMEEELKSNNVNN